jgi:CheY-like chemotaxis protein
MAKVLVVEDIAVEAEVLAIILEKHSYEVMTAADGAAALQACHRFLPDRWCPESCGKTDAILPARSP